MDENYQNLKQHIFEYIIHSVGSKPFSRLSHRNTKENSHEI